MAKHRVAWPVGLICGALGVSRSGFYAWLSRSKSQRSQSDEVMVALARQSFAGSDRTYDARRVQHEVLALGHSCGLHPLNALCASKLCGHAPGAADCSRTEAGAVRLPTTYWTANSRSMGPIRSEWRTSAAHKLELSMDIHSNPTNIGC